MSRVRTISRFLSPLVVGERVFGESVICKGARRRVTQWNGIYRGVRPSEWTGADVHFFEDGVIGSTPQRCFAINKEDVHV